MRKTAHILITLLMLSAPAGCGRVQKFVLKGYDSTRGLVFGGDPTAATRKVGVDMGFRSNVGKSLGELNTASIYVEPFVTRHLLWKTAQQQSALKNWQDGVKEHLKGRHQTALKFYDKALEDDHTLFEALANRSVAQAALNDFLLAHADVTVAMGLVEAGDLYFRRGWINYRLRSLEEAESDLAQAIEKDSHVAGYHALLGVVFYEQEKIEDARDALEEAADLAADQTRFILALASIDVKQGKWQQAEERLTDIIEDTENTDTVVYRKRAKVYFQQKKWQQAKADLEKVMARSEKPDKNTAFMHARVMQKLGEWRIAVDEFSTLLKKTPEDTGLISNRASCLNSMGKHSAALKDVNRAIGMAPEKPGLYLLRQKIYTAMKKNSKAAADHRKYLQLLREQGQNP